MPKCFNGKYLGSKEKTVPCGKCRACRRQRQTQWAARIIQEMVTTYQAGGHCEFVTLTYKPSEVPRTFGNVLTLHKAEFLRWLNIQRNTISPFRYYAVGEYGEMRGRPHIHMALFCKHASHANALAEAWEKEKGHANRKPLIGARAAYLAKYTAKNLISDTDKRLKRDQEPEFRTSSTNPGLGFDFARMVAAQWSKSNPQKVLKAQGDIDRTFRFDGKIYPLTQYTLSKAREILDIPLRHGDRENLPGYTEKFGLQEAEECPEKHRAQEKNLAAQEQRKKHRTHHQRL